MFSGLFGATVTWSKSKWSVEKYTITWWIYLTEELMSCMDHYSYTFTATPAYRLQTT